MFYERRLAPFLPPHCPVPTALLMAEEDVINEEPRTHTYPPSSSILPISDSSVGDTDDKKGLFDSTNETKRAMKSRHLTMIGMYPINSGTTVIQTFFRPAIGGTIGTGIFLSAGSVRRSSSLSYCCMKLTYIAPSLYRHAVLLVHSSPTVFSGYSFTL